MNETLAAWVAPRRARLDELLSSRFDGAWPESFGEMCRYPIRSGGKRMRPLWAVAAYEAIKSDGDLDEVVNSAAAIELIHTYSLVHDDLPCMDDDDERRGAPTVHVKYGEAPALLVGDALLTEAFRLSATASPVKAGIRAQIVEEIAEASGFQGMIGGQAADIGLAGAVEDVETLIRLHEGKTGALIRLAARVGGLCAGASDEELAALTTYGEAIGLAFQLADDILDAEEDAGDDGPPSYVKLLGVDRCRERATALREQALEAIAPFGERGETLALLARYTIDRDY